MYRRLIRETLDEGISDLTASRDLKAMVHAGLLEAVGQCRGRYYSPTAAVVKLRAKVREARPARSAIDPFEIARGEAEPQMI